jgi:hypothetical protein
MYILDSFITLGITFEKKSEKCNRVVGQFIRRNNEVALHELAEELRNQCKLTVSTSRISFHLNHLQYENCVPLNASMLTK